MPLYHFAAYTARSFFEVHADTEEEARRLLWDDDTEYLTGSHTDTIDGPDSYELIDIEETAQ